MTIIYPNALRQKSPWQGPCGPRRTSAGIGAALAKSTSVDYRRGRGDMTWSTCTVGPWQTRTLSAYSWRAPIWEAPASGGGRHCCAGPGRRARGPGRRHAAVPCHSPKAAREQKYWSWDKQCIAGMAPEAWGSFASWPSPPFYSKLMRRSTWHAPGVGRLLFTEHC